VVGGDVVGDEIENQANTAFGEFPAGDRQPLRSSEPGIDRIVADAVRGADVVRLGEIGESPAEVGEEPRVSHGNADAGGTALPDPHQPHGVAAEGGDGVPFLFRNRSQGDRGLLLSPQFLQPDPGVDLVNDRSLRPGVHG
jgi:hypothetical protein